MIFLIATPGEAQSPLYKISHYCSCKICCQQYSDGRFANNEICEKVDTPTIACNWLKFGTKVKIDGIIYTVRDRGAKRYFGSFKSPKKAFDIYCRSHSEAKNKGVLYTNNVEVIK